MRSSPGYEKAACEIALSRYPEALATLKRIQELLCIALPTERGHKTSKTAEGAMQSGRPLAPRGARLHVECLLLVDRQKNRCEAEEIHKRNVDRCTSRGWRDDMTALAIDAAKLARLAGKKEEVMTTLAIARDGIRRSESVGLRIEEELEKARFEIQFGAPEGAFRHARAAQEAATRRGIVPLECDALCLMVEASAPGPARDTLLNRVVDIVDGLHYARRAADLTLLWENRSPVLELGV